MSNGKAASLYDKISEADIARLSEQAGERLNCEQIKHKRISLAYFKMAFANRPFKGKDKIGPSIPEDV